MGAEIALREMGPVDLLEALDYVALLVELRPAKAPGWSRVGMTRETTPPPVGSPQIGRAAEFFSRMPGEVKGSSTREAPAAAPRKRQVRLTGRTLQLASELRGDTAGQWARIFVSRTYAYSVLRAGP